MTSFGVIFIAICIISLFKPIKFIFSTLVISCVFQAAAVAHIGDRGIPALFVAEFFLIAKTFLGDKKERSKQWSSALKYLFLFYIVAILTTYICPHIFEGIRVVRAGASFHSTDLIYGKIRSHLQYSMANTLQLLYLTLHVLTLCCIFKKKESFDADFLYKILNSTIIIVCVIGFWELAAKTTNKLFFPDSFFYSNQTYTQLWLQGSRMNSTFTEPSYCGSFLSASLWALIVKKTKDVKLIVLNSICLILNMSGTGIMAFIIFGAFLLFRSNMKAKLLIFAFFTVLCFLVYIMSYDSLILNLLLEKNSSVSGLIRSSVVKYTVFDLIPQTYFMGVGLGSHRDYSFITGLVASVGIIGTILFVKFIWSLIKPLLENKKFVFVVFFVTFFIAQCLAVPDFTFPILWMSLFLLMAANNNERNKLNIIHINHRK